MARGDLTDEQWARLEPLSPKGTKPGRPPIWPRRQLIDGIRWRTRTGTPWRDVPERYGPWHRVYVLFRRRQRRHVEASLHRPTGPGGREEPDHLGCQCRLDDLPRSPARRRSGQKGDLHKEPPSGVEVEPGDHGLGRSRGGLTTKAHLAVEQGQKPLPIVITAGQRGDSPQFQPVLENIRVPRQGPGRPRKRPGSVRADKTPHAAMGSSSCCE
ncbi:IS5 family transposase [Streptomyces sp. MUSC 14]|uniref:IS5 family transposase n=1 Tax=Streptomyces sp. MUSC 14 TaxID=1354889 RepID=UPI000A826902